MKLSLDALTMTLYDLGWVAHDGVNPKMKPWIPGPESRLRDRHLRREEIGVLVPQDPTAPDFGMLMEQAVSELTRLAEADVQERLRNSSLRLEESLDVFSVHAQTGEKYAGIVNFQQGLDLLSGMKNMLKAGAKTFLETRPRHRNSAYIAAEEYLHNCYLGQTEAASFVASAYVPGEKPVKLNKRGVEVEGRVITKTLLAALQATRDVLDEYRKTPDPEVIGYGVSQGVSYDLLRAVQQIVGRGDSAVSIDLLNLEVTNGGFDPRTFEVVFTPDHKRVANKAQKLLENVPKKRWTSASGEVIELGGVLEGTSSQLVRLRETDGDNVRNFIAHLGPEDYDKAQRARRDRVLLNIMGTEILGGFQEVERVSVTKYPVGENEVPPQRIELPEDDGNCGGPGHR